MSIEDAIEATLRKVLEERLRPLEERLRALQPANDVLDVDGAAALLGFSPRTVRLRAKKGGIPCFKPPGSREWRFNRGELDAWMRGRGVDTEREARKIAANLRRR